ncbi:MAG: hypothetical protein CMA64_00555 [Euryarchaeota archaeon]|nr:hypothetical protein [Euryarchaeota archaeon]
MVRAFNKPDDLLVETLYNVGDSFATGVGLDDPKLEAYPVQIANAFDSKLVSLARPGCCNFSISLMIDWVVKHGGNMDSSFLLASTTNENRLHWLLPLQKINEPCIEDLNYSDYEHDLLTRLPFNPTNKMQSETCSNILLYNKGGLPGNKALVRDDKGRLETLEKYITEIHDMELKRRHDVNALIASLHRLNMITSAWCIITTWWELHKEFPNNCITDLDFGKVATRYPDHMGSGHFDRTGHRIISRRIESWYNENIDTFTGRS